MLLLIFANSCSSDISNETIQTVTFETTIDCENCKTKLFNNIPHEKGIVDLKVEVPTKLVTITYNRDETGIEKLISILKELGYEAKVKIEVKQ